MAFLKFENVGISGISACVPTNISKNSELTDLIQSEEILKTINLIGIKEKRFVNDGVSPSDLCYEAAEKLLSDLKIDRSTIDVLIFMSQLPDYRIPATAPSLQHRLGLQNSTACFDMSLACSGYVYALSTAYAYASQPNIRKVLLLDGETFSKIVNPRDKVNMPLYGDAGTATLIEKGDFGLSFFSLNSDGAGVDAIKITAGGAKCPTNNKSISVLEREDGNFRSDTDIYMDGMEVFNFTMKVVPKNIKEIIEFADETLDNIDKFVFHQANKFMTDFFIKKLKIPPEKAPYSLDRFGNTSSASIPLTITTEMKNDLENSKKKILLSGFGAGLSWASAIINTVNCKVIPLIEK